MSILIVILILSFLVLIHELGHYLMAKKHKINVEEFGIGFPPKLIKLFKWQGTDFTLNAIPIGGFVKMEGEDGPPQENNQDQANKKTKKATNGLAPFYEKSIKARAEVILAGVVINFLFGILAFSLIYSFTGIPVYLEEQARIEEVMAGSPAEKAGLNTSVNIKAIQVEQDFYPIKLISDVHQVIEQHKGEEVTVITTGFCQELECNTQEEYQYQIYLRTDEETPQGEGSMGVRFKDSFVKFYPWYQMPFRSILFGLSQALALGWLVVAALFQVIVDLFSGVGLAPELAGPVGIISYAHQTNLASSGLINLVSFAGMLSVNLAVMNLLPIPALDGGRALFIFLEKIVGRAKIEKIEGVINYSGFALLMALFIMVTIRDVWRIFTGFQIQF